MSNFRNHHLKIRLKTELQLKQYRQAISRPDSLFMNFIIKALFLIFDLIIYYIHTLKTSLLQTSSHHLQNDFYNIII